MPLYLIVPNCLMKYNSHKIVALICVSATILFTGLVSVSCASKPDFSSSSDTSISKPPTCESVAQNMAVELALELANSDQAELYPIRPPSEWKNAIRAELREQPIVENLQEGELVCAFTFYNESDPIGNAYICFDKTGKWLRVNSDSFQPIDCITALRRYNPNI